MNPQNGHPAAPPGFPFPQFAFMAAPVQQQVPHFMQYYRFPHFPQYAGGFPNGQFQFPPVFVPPAAYQAAAIADYQRVQLLAQQHAFQHAQQAAMILAAQVPEVAPEAVGEPTPEPEAAVNMDATDEEDEIIDVETVSEPASPAIVTTDGFAIAAPLPARSPSPGVAPRAESPVPMQIYPVVINDEATPPINGFAIASPLPARSPSPGVAPRAESTNSIVGIPIEPVVINDETINRFSYTPPLHDVAPVEPENTATSTNTTDPVYDRPIVRPRWYETPREMTPMTDSDFKARSDSPIVIYQRCARMRCKNEIEDDGYAAAAQTVPRSNRQNAPIVDPLEGINPELRRKCAAGDFCILLEYFSRLTGPAQWVRCGNKHAKRWFHSVCVRMQNSKFRKTTTFFCCGKTQTQEGRSAVTGAIWRRWKNTIARGGTSCRSEVMKMEKRRKKK